MHAPLVIVVDDDASVRKALARLLRTQGFTVHTWASAEEFLNEDRACVGCLVIDVRLTGISGFELQDKLLEAGHIHPIVFISGHADALKPERLARPGTLALLSKPVEPDRLLELVSQGVAKGTVNGRLSSSLPNRP
jgi:FixJ family two-component response regulator